MPFGAGLRGYWRESAVFVSPVCRNCSGLRHRTLCRAYSRHRSADIRHARAMALSVEVHFVAFLPLKTLRCPGPSANHGVFAPGGCSEPRLSWAMWPAAGWGIHSVKGGKGGWPSRLTANASLLAAPSACLTVLERTPSCCRAAPLLAQDPRASPFPPIPSWTPHPATPATFPARRHRWPIIRKRGREKGLFRPNRRPRFAVERTEGRFCGNAAKATHHRML